MPGPFYSRLRSYFLDVAAVLRGEAKASSVFPNSTDVGVAREHIYAEFLRQHAPSKCNVFLGGFLFGEDGSESAQLDVIVTTDTTPRYNLHNKTGHGKSFSPVEGTLGVASIKSTLNQQELEDALTGIAGIPPTSSLENRINILMQIKNYDDWPYKIVYSSNGIGADTLFRHLHDYYQRHPEVPLSRRPNVIHVSGKYAIFRAVEGMFVWDAVKQQRNSLMAGTFHLVTDDADLQAIGVVLDGLQSRATWSNHILYSYSGIFGRMMGMPTASSK